MNSQSTQSSRSLWAWVPAVLLGSMLVGLGVLTYIAVDDPHFALEPNYYDKAVHWDQARAAARRSSETGFQLKVAPLLAADGVAPLELELRDRAGNAVQGAEVTVEAFPNAYANHVQRVTLREVTPGRYRAELRGAVLGLWELRLTATSGGARFEQVLRRDMDKRGAA